jgi:hypothetical protein
MVHSPSLPLNTRRGRRRTLLRLAAAAVALASPATLAAGLNDTGQTNCYNATGVVEPCAGGGQDGRYGRDAATTAGAVLKTGAGVAGFDFTKIGNNGSVLGAGAVFGANPTDWACTRDNVTGLTWEIKTASNTDLRYMNHAYTWYSTAANNGGVAGGLGVDSCNGTLAAYANQCNTTNYVLAVNAATLCGLSDWRLPTVKELQSIKNFGADDPAIDTSYFPNTVSSFYWSADTYALLPSDAWFVNFSGGQSGNVSTNSSDKTAGIYIRLVQGGP